MTDKKTKKNDNVTRKPGPGRPKGRPNKVTSIIKDAILAAADRVGEDGGGKGGVTGYLINVAKEDKKAFCALLGKIVPTEVVADITTRTADVTDEIMTPEEWAQQSKPQNLH